MVEITGTHNTAICYTDELEPATEAQIKTVCDRMEFADYVHDMKIIQRFAVPNAGISRPK